MAPGIAATCENRPREMIRQAQLARRDQDQKFRILKRIMPSPERVSSDREFRETRQPGDRVGFFRIG